ncbi:MAG: hypothetical protein H0W64_01400 [Gammaproteobacteria bacterium]|nr:hypothetical protein [Gammaproteobacteria bacterium]
MQIYKCDLKGCDSDAIPEKLYFELKAKVQAIINKLIAKGFEEKEIKIYFDDTQRLISFDYYPDEIDALFYYLNLTNEEFPSNYVRKPFEKNGWIGNRLRWTYKKSDEEILQSIDQLCQQYDKKNQEPEGEGSTIKLKLPKNDNNYRNYDERNKNILDSLKSLFKGEVRGCFIGEIHHHQYPKRFLIEHLKELKEIGIDTLFIEFLYYDAHQALLDEYFKGTKDALPATLESFLNYKDSITNCKKYKYGDIVVAAKKAGIRVVGLDCYDSLLSFGEFFSRVEKNARIKTFNIHAYNIIKKESKGRYAAFMGLDHSYINGHTAYPQLKSVAELCSNSCSVHLSDDNVSVASLGLFKFNGYPLFANEENVKFERSNQCFGATMVSVL